MAAVFRGWARAGFTEGTSGHISVRDPEFPGCIWMNPIGRHFGLLNGRDMVCLRVDDGQLVGGNRVSTPKAVLLLIPPSLPDMYPRVSRSQTSVHSANP